MAISMEEKCKRFVAFIEEVKIMVEIQEHIIALLKMHVTLNWWQYK